MFYRVILKHFNNLYTKNLSTDLKSFVVIKVEDEKRLVTLKGLIIAILFRAAKCLRRGSEGMTKRFNTTGVCIPKKHYMVDISNKIDEIEKLVSQEFYYK